MKQLLGNITQGTVTQGFLMRVNPALPSDEIRTGKFVSIITPTRTFFSLITNLQLELAHNDILLFPPDKSDGWLHEFLRERDLFMLAELKPMITLTEDGTIKPVTTIPHHFAPVHEATAHDIARVFGKEDSSSKRYFAIGSPLDMKADVCIDFTRFVERSNAIFGKTGTGKTFLTRLILSGLLKQEQAVPLIFDMHSEYGLQARSEGNKAFVKGLKTLFPDKIALFTLDPISTRRRGGAADVDIVIPYESITVEDVLALQDELNLHSTAFEAAYLVAARYKSAWLTQLLAAGEMLKEFAQDVGAHPESIAALYRKLKRLELLPFLQRQSAIGSQSSSINDIMAYLDRGIGVIIEFGNYTATFVYLLLASIITRRIHTAYTQKTELFLGSQKKSDEPRQLLITIEEAHKFLNPHAARQTIFGKIAREMRKYYVSLLIVDQRPSGIDQEILSQIGTKIIAQLNDEKDIAAVLTGVNGSTHLKQLLSTLDSKKQALLVGHATTMPIVIETRPYDEQFYAAMRSPLLNKSSEQLIKELF